MTNPDRLTPDLAAHRHQPNEDDCMEILRRYKAGEPPEQIVSDVLGQKVEEPEAYRILAFAAEVHPDTVSLIDLLEKELPDTILVLELRAVLESVTASNATKLSAMKLAHELKGRLGKTDPRATDPRDVMGTLFALLQPATPYTENPAPLPEALPPERTPDEDQGEDHRDKR